MEDDFNTGGAIGALFPLLQKLNYIAGDFDQDPQSPMLAVFKRGVEIFRVLSSILGLFYQPPEAKKLGGDDSLVTGLMQLLIDLRSNIRAVAKEAAKDNPLKKPLFDQTDLIRKRLADLGVTLEDRATGTTWRVG